MKQIVQVQRTGTLSLKDIPEPLLRAEGVVVRTAFSLISAGTERSKIEVARKSLLGKALAKPDQVRLALDLVRQAGVKAAYDKVSARLNALEPLGYSLAGVVVAAGSNAGDFLPGDRVACAGAAFANHAEYVYVPRNLCARVPEGIGLDAAAYATVGAIALHGVRQTAPTLGETVGVVGLGLLGLLTVQLLRSNGCRVIGVDVDPDRCALAMKFGADVALHPEDSTLEGLAHSRVGHGLDAVIICAATKSNEPIQLAGHLCRDKGRVVVLGAVGLEVPRAPFYGKEIDLRMSRSYGPGRYDVAYEEHGQDYPVGYVRWTEARNLEAWLDQLAQGRLDVSSLTTHRFAIQEAERAYELLENRTREPYLGILLDFQLPQDLDVVAERPSSVSINRIRRDGTLGIGLIGSGSFAQSVLLPTLAKCRDLRFGSVASSSGLSARTVADRYKFEQCAADASVILDDPNLDLLFIATRHDSHAALAARAIRNGKAVFVEKPLALNDDQLNEVSASIASATDPFLMVGFNRRFAPLCAEMKQFVTEGKEPMMMHYRVNAGLLPRDHWVHHPGIGGGRVIGEVCHFIDTLAWMCGSSPIEVYAAAMRNVGRYSRDNVSLTVRFADGSVGTILYSANGAKRLGKERIEVFCGGRVGVLDDFQSLTLMDGKKTREKRGAQDKGHYNEIKSFVEAVRSHQPSPLPFKQAVAVTRATFAVLQSIAVDLPVAIDTSSDVDG